MTEILGSDDPDGAASAADAVAPENRYDLSEPDDADDAARVAPPHRRLRGALADPAALAVSSALAVPAALLAGPTYRFDVYPFSIGVTSLRQVFSVSATSLHPLRSYVATVAPTALLLLLALVTGVVAVSRAHERSPSWARPVAAGATIVAAALLALVVAGAWHVSTLDLTVPPNAATF